MKITHNKIGQNLNLSDLGKTDKAEASKNEKVNGKKVAENTAKDLLQTSNNEAVKVDLSNRAQDIRQAKELAMASPDVNFEKVEKFQKLIDEGKYKVDSKAVANRMVDDNLMLSGSQRTGDE